MLLASPAACYRLFREKQKEGQGEAIMFKGKGTAPSGTAGATRGHFPCWVSFSGMPACRPQPPPALFRESEWDGRDKASAWRGCLLPRMEPLEMPAELQHGAGQLAALMSPQIRTGFFLFHCDFDL